MLSPLMTFPTAFDYATSFDALPIRKEFADYWTFYFMAIALSCAQYDNVMPHP